MKTALTVFVSDPVAIEKYLQGIKLQACPFCGKTGTLNRHSRMNGNDTRLASGTVNRGQRVFCSNRGRRNGCGRTFPVFFASVLPRHTFTAPLLWKSLRGWLTGSSIKASWESSGAPLSLDTFYHLLQRLRRKLDALRTALHALAPAPGGTTRDPLRQTLEHLRAVFATDPCPPERFQLRIQRPMMN